MKKEKMVRRILCNVAIVGMLCAVVATTFGTAITNVFSESDAQAIYRGNVDKKNMALMVNVYWGTEFLPQMLDTMRQKGVKCTFFIGGSWAAENAEMLKKIYDDGHEIGNHGYYHKDCDKIAKQRNREEIMIAERMIEGIIGVKTTLFAPPSGAYNKMSLAVAAELGYKTIMWSQDTIDWRDHNPSLILKRATEKAANGNLVLMHPTRATSDALDDIIDRLKGNGYNLTTVSNTL